jgi:hypothetical protein
MLGEGFSQNPGVSKTTSETGRILLTFLRFRNDMKLWWFSDHAKLRKGGNSAQTEPPPYDGGEMTIK